MIAYETANTIAMVDKIENYKQELQINRLLGIIRDYKKRLGEKI